MPIETTGNPRVDTAAAEIAVALRDANPGRREQSYYDEATRLRDEIMAGARELAQARPPVHVRIVQDGQTVADLPDWTADVPRKGDYIFHPANGTAPAGIAGCVATVVWRTHDRTPAGFVQTARPYVELTFAS